MRFATAIAVVAIAFAAAVYFHQRHVTVAVPAVGHPKPFCSGSCYFSNSKVLGYTGGTPAHSYVDHPSWEDPVAVLVGIGGLAVAAGIVTARR